MIYKYHKTVDFPTRLFDSTHKFEGSANMFFNLKSENFPSSKKQNSNDLSFYKYSFSGPKVNASQEKGSGLAGKSNKALNPEPGGAADPAKINPELQKQPPVTGGSGGPPAAAGSKVIPGQDGINEAGVSFFLYLPRIK